ncbi:unnamed protein product [Bemisia tabaci]
MNSLVLCAFVGSFIVGAFAAPAETYTTEFDGIDIDSVLKNEKLLDAYAKCLLDEGPCTREGRTLKTLLPDALETTCAKCSPTQKEKAKKVITFYMEKYPENAQKIMKKYDPTGKYRKALEEAFLGSL